MLMFCLAVYMFCVAVLDVCYGYVDVILALFGCVDVLCRCERGYVYVLLFLCCYLLDWGPNGCDICILFIIIG